MSDVTKRDEWVHFYKASSVTYKPWALEACLSQDGPKMLAMVLKVLKLEKTQDLITEICRNPK